MTATAADVKLAETWASFLTIGCITGLPGALIAGIWAGWRVGVTIAVLALMGAMFCGALTNTLTQRRKRLEAGETAVREALAALFKPPNAEQVPPPPADPRAKRRP